MPHRVLHLSDLHLERRFASMGCHTEAARRRRDGLREALQSAGALAQERDCTAVTLGGDLYEDSRAGASTAAFLAGLFASWQPLRVFIAPGNHDPLHTSSIYARTEWSSNVHIFQTASLEPVTLAPDVHLWGLAHREPRWTGDPLEAAQGRSGSVNLALFHGAEVGSRPDGKSLHGPFRADAVKAAGFSLALCGHYHGRRQDLARGVLYPGTPEPLDFDEGGRRGPVIVEVSESGEVSLEPVDNNRWHAVTVAVSVDDAGSASEVVERVLERAAAEFAAFEPDRTMLRADLVGDARVTAGLDCFSLESALRARLPVAGLALRDQTTTQIDIASARDEHSSRGAFTRRLLDMAGAGDSSEAELAGEALHYGLTALAGAEIALR